MGHLRSGLAAQGSAQTGDGLPAVLQARRRSPAATKVARTHPERELPPPPDLASVWAVEKSPSPHCQ